MEQGKIYISKLPGTDYGKRFRIHWTPNPSPNSGWYTAEPLDNDAPVLINVKLKDFEEIQ